MSTEENKTVGRCRMLLNSGEADPEWEVDAKTAGELLDYFEEAKPYQKVFDIPLSDGYHGVVFFYNNNSYTAYKGKIEYTVDGQKMEKADLGRSFEQMVLKTSSPEFKAQSYNQLTTDFD